MTGGEDFGYTFADVTSAVTGVPVRPELRVAGLEGLLAAALDELAALRADNERLRALVDDQDASARTGYAELERLRAALVRVHGEWSITRSHQIARDALEAS